MCYGMPCPFELPSGECKGKKGWGACDGPPPDIDEVEPNNEENEI